jgi:hypothetical protein
MPLRWDLGFESTSLQRRVVCEPEDDISIPVPRGSTITQDVAAALQDATGEDIVMGARVFADAAAAVFKAGRTRYFLFSMFHKNAIGASTTPVR